MKQYISPYIFIAFLLPSFSYLMWIGTRVSQDSFITSYVLAALSVVSGIIIVVRKKNVVEKKYAKFLIGAGILIIFVLSWHNFYIIYKQTTGYQSDIFRTFVKGSHFPIYGKESLNVGAWGLVLIMFSFAFTMRIIGWRDGWTENRGLTIELFLWFAGLLIFFSLSDSPAQLSKRLVHYLSFASDIEKFEGISHLLRSYTQLMPQLSIHNGHYPPGNLLLIMIEFNEKIPGFSLGIVHLCTFFTLIPIIGISSELNIPTYVKNFALALFISAPIVPSIPSVAMTPIPMLLAGTALWLTLVSIRTKSILLSIIVGAVVAVGTFFSFTVAIVGLLLTLVMISQVVSKHSILNHTLWLSIISLISYFIIYYIFYLFTEFNLFACFVNSIEHNKQLMSPGFDSFVRYLFRSTGNLLAWQCSVGFFASVFGIIGSIQGAFKLNECSKSAISIAVFSALILASFSSLFFLETERVWLFFIPPWVIIASMNISKDVPSEHKALLFKSVLIFSIIVTVSQELVFQPWR